METEQLLLDLEVPTTKRTYDEFPKPPNHKHIVSIDPEMPPYAWSQEDWKLYMHKCHPHIHKNQ